MDSESNILKKLNYVQHRLATMNLHWNSPSYWELETVRSCILEIVSILQKKEVEKFLEKENNMDKQIRKIEKEVKSGKINKAEKDLKHLEKEDKKRDKIVTAGKKALMMKKKAKK